MNLNYIYLALFWLGTVALAFAWGAYLGNKAGRKNDKKETKL